MALEMSLLSFLNFLNRFWVVSMFYRSVKETEKTKEAERRHIKEESDSLNQWECNPKRLHFGQSAI